MTKIVIINSLFQEGSTGRICFNMKKYFEQNGMETRVYFGRKSNKQNQEYYFGNKLDLYIHAFLSRITDKHGLFSKRTTKKLIKELTEYNPDIYLLHNIHGYYINYPLLFKFLKKEKKPVIWLLHDCWSFTGHCACFSSLNCEKWKECCSKCKYTFLYPKSIFPLRTKKNYLLKKKYFTSIDNLTIVCPSKFVTNLAKMSYFKDNCILTINNGIDISVFKKKEITNFRNKYNLNNYNLILCIAFVFDEKKGIHDVIELSKKLSENEKIILIGKCNIKLPDNIIHINRTNNVDELVDIYSSCDVFFNPTYEDNYPTVNLESIACELPIVCYNTGGAVETVDSRYVVEQGDIDESLRKIRYLCSNKTDYSFMNRELLGTELMLDSYLKLIKEKVTKDEKTYN